MAFNTKMPHKTSWSAIAVFNHKNMPQIFNSSLPQRPSINAPGKTWNIITSNQLVLQGWSIPLKPNVPFYKHLSINTEEHNVKHAKLVKHVQRLIAKVNDDRFEDLIMVDALERLGIDYHFEDDINLILRRRYMQFNNIGFWEHQNLYEASLCFRVLRQNGFHVSADVFTTFRGNDNKFEENLKNDIRGLMGLYEASQLSIGESILDEAAEFSCQVLKETITFLDDDQARMVRHTLQNPYRKSLPMLNLKNSIKDFNGTILQELAELDFNMRQSMHQKEANQIIGWWKDLGLGQKLHLARDQALKWYLWSMAALTNPRWSKQRINLTKIISLIYIIDDIFDVYGSLDELTLFTEAIHRWDINDIEQLPYQMRSSFKAVYDITNEIANQVYEQYGFNPISSLWKSWTILFDAFLVEAKWFSSGHIPKAKQYLNNGIVTTGVPVVLVHMFFLLGNGTSKECVSLINDNHGIISSVAKILRLWDDLGSAQDENQDGYDGSYVKCFLKEHEDCSIKIAHEHVNNLISDTWKRLNKDCLTASPFSVDFKKVSINIARMVPLMYSYGDNGTLPLLDDYVKSILCERL